MRGEERDEKKLALLRNDIVMLQCTVLVQRRDLQIHSHTSNGETRDQRKCNDNDRKIRNIVDTHQAEEGNLITFPQHQPEASMTRGERVRAFIECYIIISEGPRLGQSLLLDDFQKRF